MVTCKTMADGEHAGQLRLVDGEMGRHDASQLHVFLVERLLLGCLSLNDFHSNATRRDHRAIEALGQCSCTQGSVTFYLARFEKSSSKEF